MQAQASGLVERRIVMWWKVALIAWLPVGALFHALVMYPLFYVSQRAAGLEGENVEAK